MKLLVNVFFIAAISLLAFQSCKKDKTQEPVIVPATCPDTISFTSQVEPLIQASCSTTGCHDAISAAAGFNLVGYSNIKNNATIVLNSMQYKTGLVGMPLGAPQLPDSLIQQVDCWIQQGTQNN